MKIITLEEHFTNPTISAAIQKAVDKLSPSHRAAYSNKDITYSPSMAQMEDLSAGRIASMDANGIDVQVLSYSAPGTQLLPPTDAIPLIIDANDQLAEAIKAHPDRFAGFAMLPMNAPEEAAAELERTVNKLNFKGVMINGRTDDLFLDHPKFSPILEAVAALDVPIYLHPTIPPKAVQEAYYNGLDPIVSARFATSGFGWHAEAGIHAMRMILGGVFDRFPNLQLILGHWGEMIPPFLDRLDESLSPATKNLEQRVSEYFSNHVYATPSGMLSLPQLMLTLQVMGADRLMYSVDYPYVGNEGARAFLENAPISPADKEKIAHGNAERLLKL
ncbi:amidohydrolase family protein [Priestia megaterium]|uniref:amidohydrolase family protein n=1 Tax=Priestia megaterium TaxID=1404 RepID=UPI00366B3762